ncbi:MULTISPECIES: ABC transporter permease [Natrinema]|uniref:ABC-2 type transporter n=1 Tax=Natrinema gari JCM 14663 TaxID=1230459 RepID=L9YZJ1_9EURY|nr:MULTISPECIES: ABC transporter permease [Natrinema]AFO55913.1 ABC-2 type transporter [Natrinema sp. J7-2]ELY79509.1 ABC-2 type transporter [Natrinema gari JCM 14663]
MTDELSGNSFGGDVVVNTKRWGLKAIRNPFVLAVSLIQPLVFLVLFLTVFGNVAGTAVNDTIPGISYESFLLPAIIMQVALASAVSSGVGLVNDIETGMFEKILASPMRPSAMLLGKIIADFARIVVQIAIVVVIGLLLGTQIKTGTLGILGVVGVGVVFSGWYLAFSNALAVLTEDQESTTLVANLLQLPLLFLSSSFLPVNALPEWIRPVALVNPVTYGVDVARSIILGRNVVSDLPLANSPLEALLILFVFDFLFAVAGIFFLLTRTRSDVQ